MSRSGVTIGICTELASFVQRSHTFDVSCMTTHEAIQQSIFAASHLALKSSCCPLIQDDWGDGWLEVCCCILDTCIDCKLERGRSGEER